MNQLYCFFIILVFSSQTGASMQKKLPRCPNSPNCVSSQAQKDDKQHYVKPFEIITNAETTWLALKNILATQARTIVSKESEFELELQVSSLIFRFVDDLQIILDKETMLIHIRSASRTGYSDLGVNRKRVEILRQQLQQASLIK